MLSSKKIMYFVIMSALMLCFLQGIDFMANEAMAATVVEIPTFAESGFSRLPEINSLDPSDDNTAVSDPNGMVPDDASPTAPPPTAPSAVTQPTEAITDPTTSASDVSGTTDTTTTIDPALTEPTTTIPTTAPTTAPTTTSTTLITTTAPIITTTAPVIITTTAPLPTTLITTLYTTTRTTTTQTTTTTATQYYDSGNISFTTYQLTVYVDQNATNSVRIPIGGQKRISFSSMNPSIVSVSSLNDTTAYITGISSGTGWIQGRSLSGDVCYCKVTVIDFADEVLRLTNEQRRMYGLRDLEPGTDLMDYIANVRLTEAQSYFSHTRPNGQKFEYAAIDAGLEFYRVGENLACGQLTPQAVVNAWMNSPTHRDNILDPGFVRLSIANGTGPDGAMYWVQFFWQPHS